MSLKEELLLQQLPPHAKVVNCGDCGQLTTTEWNVYKKFAKHGLRLIGWWLPHKSGHRVPSCMGCSEFGRNIPGPGEHRPLGQGVPIWREMKSL